MTTIVAVQGAGWTVIGSDSRVTDEGRIYSMPKGVGKVVENEEYLFGTAGDLRAINIIEHAFNPPDASGYAGKDLDAFITTRFIPALRKCFEEHGYATGVEEKESKEAAIGHDSTIMVSINGCIYEIDGDYAWIKDATGLYAMGTGGDYAVGALHAMLPPKTKLTIELAKETIKEALTIAAKLDSSSGGPFTIIVQES
jgi:ATP-dependent protease HslVU (ClpYQ) peptidase subunit